MESQALEQIKQAFSQGNLIEVEKMALQGLQTEPDQPLLNKMLGICLFQRGQFSDAAKRFSHALSLEPEDGNCLNNLGSCYLFQNQHREAADYFQRALATGKNPEWHRNLGTCYYELGLFNRAAEQYQQAIDSGLLSDMMLVRQVDTLKQASRFREALALCDRIVDVPQRLVEQAAIYVETNRPELARDCLAVAQTGAPFNPQQQQRLHNIYRFLGDRQNEQKVVESFAGGNLEQQMLARVMKTDLSDEELAALTRDPRLESLSSQVQATFTYILAGHYKKRDKHRWLVLLKQANRLQCPPEQVQIGKELKAFETIRQSYPQYAGVAIDQPSDKPIFIVGMPRSGTTLVESILGNHQQVFAAGETTLVQSLLAEINPGLPDDLHPHFLRIDYLNRPGGLNKQQLQQFSQDYLQYLSDYAPGARHITDKMPHNFMHLGVLTKAFPEATIIHCVRDPIANCLSIFEQNFSPFHRYGNSLETLAGYYQGYLDLMTFWQQELGEDRILEVRYEDLVRDSAAQIQRILARIGLPWQEDLLDLAGSDRTVTTSSLEQVRQDIYQDSLKPYQGLETELAPLLKLAPKARSAEPGKSWFKRWFGG